MESSTSNTKIETRPATSAKLDVIDKAKPRAAYSNLPLSFEVNQGQTDAKVKFLSRGKGYSLFLTANETVLKLAQPKPDGKGQRTLTDGNKENQETAKTGSILRMNLVGSNPYLQVSGLEELPGKRNYFIGSDPKKWRANIPTYAKVKYQNVYPGVDLIYYGNQRELEYDFVVSPGADARTITLRFEGAEQLELDAQGKLALSTVGGQLLLDKPKVYQELAGMRQEIAGDYLLKANNEVTFVVGGYDPQRPLIIDPVLVYSTYLGGSNDDNGPFGIAVDAAGSAYLTSSTDSADFPTTVGAFDTSFNGGFDWFTPPTWVVAAMTPASGSPWTPPATLT
ncbi:MAG: hypothetical protein DMG06_29950 [Acidobacteria bacterium]|nr:MAG: hypothetical protein DMG06_29950 [Acidobacteriota bacterium]